MQRSRLKSFAIVGLALLATACADNRFRADVTRFHVSQPPTRGTVVVQPADPRRGDSLEYRTYAAAVANELREIGFIPVESPAQAELVAAIGYEQTTRQGLAQRSPVSIGVGGGSVGGNVGIGIGTTFGLGRSKPRDISVNLLAVQLKRRADGGTVWEGRAVSEAVEGRADATLSTAVPKLADALFANYPGPSGQTVRYP